MLHNKGHYDVPLQSFIIVKANNVSVVYFKLSPSLVSKMMDLCNFAQ